VIDFRIDSEKISLHPEWVADWMRGKSVYPIFVEISPVGGCNMACNFCGVDVLLGDRIRPLDADILKERLTEMASLGVKSIHAAGEGEPLLAPRLGEVIVSAKRAGLDFAITTNASPLTERFCYEALDSLSWVKASVNAGTSAAYAEIHRTPTYLWNTVWRNLAGAVRIRKELKAKCTLGIQAVLLPENAETMVELAKRGRDLGLDVFVVKPYSQQNFSETRKYNGLSYEQFADVLDRVEEFTTNDFQVVVRRNAMKAVVGEQPYGQCLSTGSLWSYITHTGDVFSCSAYLTDPRFRMGNIVTQTFRQIWDSEARHEHARFVNEELDISACRKGCRMTACNAHLWRVTRPGFHDNFI
jgi:radical SAM protein with 4Fe4S-binding SPASM domain